MGGAQGAFPLKTLSRYNDGMSAMEHKFRLTACAATGG
jgi:hypothetical protein